MMTTRLMRWAWLLVVVALAACNAAPPSPLDAGKEALQAGDTAKAIAALEPLADQNPTDANVHLLLGQAYVRADRKDDAQAAFTKGFSLKPDATFPLATQNADEYFVAGNVHAALLQFEPALAAYSMTLQLDPQKAGALTNIGVVYYQSGKLDLAVAQFKRALQLEPNDPETHYLLGAAYVQQDNQAEAEAEFTTALTLKPELAAAHIGLGNLQLLRQDFAAAVETLNKALALQADSPEALFAIGQAYAGLGQNAQAIEAFKGCLALNPPEPFRSRAQQFIQQLSTP